MLNGPIENITFENIYAGDCHTFIRMASVASPIRGITIRNAQCGCRVYAVNMDAARYCATPIFKEEDYPNGVGYIRDVDITGMTAWASRVSGNNSLMCFETNMDNFRMRNFMRDFDKDRALEKPVLQIRNVAGMKVQIDGNEYVISKKNDILTHNGVFSELSIDLAEE